MLTASFNNTNYSIPEEGELNWSYLTDYLADLALYLTNGYLANSQASITLSPIATSGTIDNLATSNKSLFNLSQASKLTGLANPTEGRFVTILNTSNNVLELTHNDTNSTDTNRIVTDDSQSYFLNPSNFITLYYDNTVNRWRVIRESVLDKSVIKSVSTVGALNDYEINNNTILLLPTVTTISGFVARPGRNLILVNTSGVAITIVDQATSSASNQIITGKGSNITLDNNTSISLFYDSISSKWRVNGSNIARSELNTVISDVSDLETNKENKSEKGIANGYASLGASGTIPVSQIDLDFKELADVPSSYTSQKGKVVKVKTDETGLEFGNSTESNNYVIYSTAIDTPSSIGYATYADSASSSPVDGTGGSANITFTRNTSSPISSDADFHFAKDAVNRQGQGVSYDFEIDRRHNAKVLQLTLDSSLVSGTYTRGDLTFYIIDKTSGEVIQPINYQIELPIVGLSTKLIATFQTHITNTEYRLCIHTSSTSASAYTVAFNNFKIWEPESNYGAIITNPEKYPSSLIASFQGLGTITELNLSYSRRGAYLDVDGDWTNGTTTGSELRIPLPSGLTSASDLSENGFPAYCGEYNRDSASEQLVVMCENSVSYFTVANRDPSSNIFTKINGNTISQNSLKIRIKASVRIAGWGSSLTLSSDSGDGRECVAIYKNCVSGIVSSSYGFNWDTKIEDSHNAVTTTNEFIFTAPFSSVYNVSGAVISNSVIPVIVEKNGSTYGIIGYHTNAGNGGTFSGSVKLNAGDYIKIKTTGGTSGSATDAIICVRSSSNGQVIAPVETVSCRYYRTTNLASTSYTDPIIYTTKSFDTHGAYNTSTGIWTCPMSGKYQIEGRLSGVSDTIYLDILLNGAVQQRSYLAITGITSTVIVNDTLNLIAGDQIKFAGLVSGTIYTDTYRNIMTINRLGI